MSPKGSIDESGYKIAFELSIFKEFRWDKRIKIEI
jgi:hypothetical protein